MWEALREAVDEEMEKDPNVCVIGMPLQLMIMQNLPEGSSTRLDFKPFIKTLFGQVVGVAFILL